MPRETRQYAVIRDTREQEGWSFAPSKNCSGTRVATLATGDYTIVGYETDFVIERKGTIGEFASNLYELRFEKELVRLATFKHAFLVLEFTLDDVLNWPASSAIPKSRQSVLRLTNFAFLKRITELQLRYPQVQFIFAGTRGREYAASLFKRVCEGAKPTTKLAA